MFKPGDKVKRKESYFANLKGDYKIKEGEIYEVSNVLLSSDCKTVLGIGLVGLGSFQYDAFAFELFDLPVKETIYDTPSKESIAKPILEERKIGKIEMDLFDSGFPNAILEVAKVMTWAGQNKGYKPHDWTNLPNAEVEFSAAASRHKLKAILQKLDGLPANERVDEESGIVHLAHEVFNVLAQLELVLRGKIK